MGCVSFWGGTTSVWVEGVWDKRKRRRRWDQRMIDAQARGKIKFGLSTEIYVHTLSVYGN